MGNDAGRPPPGPQVSNRRVHRRLAAGLPHRVVRSDALEATRDIMAVVHREVARFKRQTALAPADVRALLDLARTAKEARQLEQLVEDELGAELDGATDAELAERAGEDGNG